jgi:hypothetical protein
VQLQSASSRAGSLVIPDPQGARDIDAPMFAAESHRRSGNETDPMRLISIHLHGDAHFISKN